MSVAEATEAPYELTRDGYANLRTAFRSGSLGSMFFGVVFGLFCAAVGSITAGLAVLALGVLVSAVILSKRRCFYKRAACTFQLSALSLTYFQLCFIAPAIVVASRLVEDSVLALFVLAMAATIFFYARYYYRAYWRAWDEKKRHNETIALDLEQSLYFTGEQFKTGNVQSLGWDEKIGKALCLLGPFGGAMLGVMSDKGEGVGALTILGVAFGFFIGMAWSQMTVQAVVNWQKLHHCERKIGKPIRNR